MLVRLVFCIDDESLLNRLKQSFADMDLLLECHGHSQSAWQEAIRSCADVIVISKSLIPQPDEVSIALLNELPEHPTTVILQDAGDSEAQARLVAMGADTVLDTGISPRSMAEAIQAVLESRRQYAETTMHAARQDFRPSTADFGSTRDALRVL